MIIQQAVPFTSSEVDDTDARRDKLLLPGIYDYNLLALGDAERFALLAVISCVLVLSLVANVVTVVVNMQRLDQ